MSDGPVALLDAWLAAAMAAGIDTPEAMTLATRGADGAPSARIVLLRGHDDDGLTFFTDRRSRKGDDLASDARCALVFHWQPLGRQVRVEGSAAPIADDESWAYYRTRPLGSRLGAWASHQSATIASRSVLAGAVAAAAKMHGDDPPLPPHWGGYRIAPTRYEFWTHDDDRLHHRELYVRDGGGWAHSLLAP